MNYDVIKVLGKVGISVFVPFPQFLTQPNPMGSLLGLQEFPIIPTPTAGNANWSHSQPL